MQQRSKYTLRALILSALITTSGMALAATTETAAPNTTQPTVTATADTSAVAIGSANTTVVNQQLRSGVVTSP